MKKEIKEFFEYIRSLEDLPDDEYDTKLNKAFGELSDEDREEVKSILIEMDEEYEDDEDDEDEDDELDFKLKQYRVIEKKLDTIILERVTGRELDRFDVLEEEYVVEDFCYDDEDFCKAELQAYQIANCMKVLMGAGITYADSLTQAVNIYQNIVNERLAQVQSVQVGNVQI